MLSRRLFLGTTAGAVGLFGWFGRLRFRPQRRGRLLGHTLHVGKWRFETIEHPNEKRLIAFYGDARIFDDSQPGDEWQRFKGEVYDTVADQIISVEAVAKHVANAGTVISSVMCCYRIDHDGVFVSEGYVDKDGWKPENGWQPIA